MYTVYFSTVVRNCNVISTHKSCSCIFEQTSGFLCCHEIACILAINCSSVSTNAGQLQKMKLSHGHVQISNMIHSYCKRKDCGSVIVLETIKQTTLPKAASLVGRAFTEIMEQKPLFPVS